MHTICKGQLATAEDRPRMPAEDFYTLAVYFTNSDSLARLQLKVAREPLILLHPSLCQPTNVEG
jgi:hypothetical protein